MSNYHSRKPDGRHVDGPRNYRVRLSRSGGHVPGDFRPSPITVFVSATSSMQARMNAQASYHGYSVTDVMEA